MMTVNRWKYTVCQLSYSRLYTRSMAGSASLATWDMTHSK